MQAPERVRGEGRYRGVRVSPLQWDFARREHSDIPRELFQSWADLIVELAHILDESFHLPLLPDCIEFEEKVEYSDGPYPSDENYVAYPYLEFEMVAEEGRGLRITYTRLGSVEMQTLRARSEIRSRISSAVHLPLAEVEFPVGPSGASPAELVAIDAAIARHHRRCN